MSQSISAITRERRIRARTVLMGLTMTQLTSIMDVSYQTLLNWMAKEEWSPKVRLRVSRVLAVPDEWLDSMSYEDVGVGLDSLLAA
jgi:hypothetical protein